MKLDTATIDRLRELGATDDMLKWLEHPEAVRELLKHEPLQANRDDAGCPSCGEDAWAAHDRMCPVAAAWRTLGDPRGDMDVERAHAEALRENATRGSALARWASAQPGTLFRLAHDGRGAPEIRWLVRPSHGVTPGWVDRAAFPRIPDEDFDLTRTYRP